MDITIWQYAVSLLYVGGLLMDCDFGFLYYCTTGRDGFLSDLGWIWNDPETMGGRGRRCDRVACMRVADLRGKFS